MDPARPLRAGFFCSREVLCHLPDCVESDRFG